MNCNRRRVVVLAMLLSLLAGSAVIALARKKDKKTGTAAVATDMDARQQAQHALNRLAFGPRPGDIDRLVAIGVDNWIEQQLHPEKIDDTQLTARLTPLRTLNMSTRDIVINFPPQQVIKAVEAGKMSMPSDPTRRAIYQAQIDRMQEKKQGQAAKAADQGDVD